jgi:hypothetical protein
MRKEQMMDYRGLVKSLVLPAGYAPPRDLVYEDIRARALSRAYLEDDVKGINTSIELIQRTRGGGWPTEAVSEEFDYVDLVWHECELREGYSFAYAVYDAVPLLRRAALALYAPSSVALNFGGTPA